MKAISSLNLTSKKQAAITAYITRAQRRFPERIRSVVLFGSQARGDAGPESDIDLLVLVDSEEEAIRAELWRIAFDVSLEQDVVISPRVFGPKRWAEIGHIRLPLYRAILTDGIPLTAKGDRHLADRPHKQPL